MYKVEHPKSGITELYFKGRNVITFPEYLTVHEAIRKYKSFLKWEE